MLVANAVRRLGGVATRAQLEALGCEGQWIRMAVGYRSILRVRRGLFASVDTPPAALRALRIGGRLACVSALEYYGLTPPSARLHVEVAANASRLRLPPDRGQVVIHWARRRDGAAGFVVLEESARRQAARCRSGAGGD